MHIVIPMTGHGSRFKRAGYTRLKPFIEVHGKPIIEWVYTMLTDHQHAYKLTFICQKDHIEQLPYIKNELNHRPNSRNYHNERCSL